MRALLVVLLASACGSSSPSDPDADPADARQFADAGPSDFRFDTVGTINLIEAGVDGWTAWQAVYASINDGPYNLLPERVAAEGDCEVWVRPSSGNCEPPCGPSATCEADGTCAPFPRAADAGRIDVDGLTVDFAFIPTEFGYYDFEPWPPEDLFADDAVITLTAAGDETAAFAVQTAGVEPLAGGPYAFDLHDGVDQELTWTPADDGAEIQLMLRVGWHGAPVEAALVCETADDGALTIPGNLISELPQASSGLEQHSSSIMRFRRVHYMGEHGLIEVIVGSHHHVSFSHL